MKVILDECLPKRLGSHIAGHDVTTVPGAGLAGLSNGKLLAAISERFDAFITIDGNIEYQQTLGEFGILIIVLRANSNRLDDLIPLTTKVVTVLEGGHKEGVFHIK